MSAEHLDQIHNLLEFLETGLIRSVRWPTDAQIEELRALNADITAAADGDLAAVNRLNRELDTERFWTLSEPYRLLHVATTDTAVATEQHDQLIDALAAQDRALSLRVLAQHRRETQTAALGMLGGPTRAASRRPVALSGSKLLRPTPYCERRWGGPAAVASSPSALNGRLRTTPVSHRSPWWAARSGLKWVRLPRHKTINETIRYTCLGPG